MKKVVCINNYVNPFLKIDDNRFLDIEDTLKDISIGSIYEVDGETGDRYRILIDGEYVLFFQSRFIDLKEYRKKKLNKLKEL